MLAPDVQCIANMSKTNTTPGPGAADFSLNTRRALARKGITIIGLTVIPNPASDMPFANGERGYCLDDNGTHRVRTFAEVRALAGVK